MFPHSDNVIKRLLDIFKGEAIWVEPSLKQVGQTFPQDAVYKFVKESLFEDLRREMVSRKYSPKTIKAYIHYNKDFLKLTGKGTDNIREEDIKDYLFQLVEEKGVATSTLNSTINALKFYYGTILKKKFPYEIKRPRKDKKLPVVLSKKEVARILSNVDNIKHKVILMLVYSAGLRVSEVVNPAPYRCGVKLKSKDIDSERKLVFVKGAKGRKDRYSILSNVALDTLRQYYKEYKPKKWFIQELLGHKSSKTTEIYTHVSNKFLGSITSPLDNLKEDVILKNNYHT